MTTVLSAFHDSSRRQPSLKDEAYRQLRNAIAELLLQPGQPLSEASLSDWLGLGRTPVREALIRLREEGLVEVIPSRGYYVSRISAEDAEEIMQMLEGLESVAASLAAERATPDDIEQLERILLQEEDSLGRDDLDIWMQVHDTFHATVVEAARNGRIRRVIEPVLAQMRRVFLFTTHLRPKPSQSTEDHRALLEAIKAHDAELAFRISRMHRATARSTIIDAIRQHVGPHGGL